MGSRAKLVLIAICAVSVLETAQMSVDEAINTNLKCPIHVGVHTDNNLVPRKIKTITCLETGNGCEEVTDAVLVWNVREGRHEVLTVSVACVENAERFVSAARLPGDH